MCTNCGNVSKPVTFTKGSFIVEVALWLMFFLPGIIYSVWRLSSKYDGCRFCKEGGMVPLSSPVAVALLEKQSQKNDRI